MERCLESLLMSAGQMEIVEGGAVGAQLVGDYQPGCEALLPERLAHEPQGGDPEPIYNWRRLDDRITTSGQPTEEQLADIRALGVKHVVNLGLHTHEKALPDEPASVGRLRMEYIHIPVDFQIPTDQDFEQFCAVMEQLKDVPVHVHCIANARVSAFFYRYRRDVLGMDGSSASNDF